VGTTNSGGVYHTLDGSAQIPASQVPVAFPGVGGFMNCSKPSGGEDSSAARSFLSDLRPKQVAAYTNVNFTNILLVASVDGPDATYRPLGVQDVNPWRYVCPGTNNTGSYDLWIQLSIAGKTNLICNWSKQVRTDSPLP
jgi:hypothetical protein